MTRGNEAGVDDWTVDEILDFVIDRFEGTKFVNHPDDRGGPTKFGITKRTLSRARGETVKSNDIYTLTRKEAKRIYINSYVDPVRGGDLEYGPLRLAVIDYAIHSGTKRAIKAIQESVSVMPDGILGPVTWHAIGRFDERSLFLKVMAHRTIFLTRLVARDTRQTVFIFGWGKRLARILESGA